MFSIAATKLSDVLKPQDQGERVNMHVVRSVKEPQPDFAAMRDLLQSANFPDKKVGSNIDAKREISPGR